MVLHLLLRKLSGRPRCASLDAFLSLDELLVDISDDLPSWQTYPKPCKSTTGRTTHALQVLLMPKGRTAGSSLR
ncbi:hypothetical protein HaLaN_28544, partial [Haematococcus lacustris]